MNETVEGEMRLTKIAGACGALSGISLITLAVVALSITPTRFEPVTDLLNSLASPQSQLSSTIVYWGLTLVSLLEMPLFLGLYRIFRISTPTNSLLGAVFGVASSVMYALSMIVYATAIPSLAGAYGSASDQDLLRSIEFQAAAFNALASGIVAVATLILAISLSAWNRAMSYDRHFKRCGLWTLPLVIYALFTILPLGAFGPPLRLGLFLLEGTWFAIVGVKIAISGQQTAALTQKGGNQL